MPYKIPEYIEIKTTDGNTVVFLSPESDNLKDCWIDDDQNGSCTLEFELPLNSPKWQYLTDQYRIHAGGKEFVILNPDAVDKQRDGQKLKGKVKAHESWVLLGKKYQTICNDPLIGTPPWGAVIIVSGGTAHGGFDAGSAGSALSYLLQDTGWAVGTVDVTGTFDLETEKESVLYNINQVQEKWGGILVWDSVNKTVSLRDEATYKPYTGYQIRYAKNLKDITRSDDYDIVTRLYVFGENDLNIEAVNSGLLYLDNHSYSDDILEGVWYNQDIADQAQLKVQGEKQLAVMCRPRHNYKTEVLDLRSLPGYGHETFKRSDMVDLFDEDFGANARVRIIRYRHNVFQPWLCDMELGDPLEKIAASVAQTVLMAKFYKNVVAPNTSFQNLLKAIINTEATEINGASGDYTLVDGVSTWFDRDDVTGELTGKLLRITPQGLIISYDGGQTWKLAISGEGFHADAGWVGKLNAGVITVGPDTTFAPGYDPVDNHLYFQYSVDGTNWHDVFNSATDLYMRQKVGDNGTWTDAARIAAVDGADGKDGINGVNGVDGQDGNPSYLHIKYSNYADGTNMNETGGLYIGTYSDSNVADSDDKAKYTWVLIKGTDGTNGSPGQDGVNAYLHIKYSNDGVNFTGNGGEDVGDWIGTYSDNTQLDSTVFGNYKWKKIRGNDGYTPVKGTDYFDGIDGQDGVNGTSSYLWVRYSQNADGSSMTTSPTNAKYIGVATTTTPSAPTSNTAYLWSLIKGTDGIPGEPGDDGQTSYLHIKYSDDGVIFTANNGETVGAWIGTYTDFTQADSMVFNDYTWNKVKGEDGQDVRKFTSQPVPPYDIGDLWIGGSDGKNTLICINTKATGSFVASDWGQITETIPAVGMGVDSDCLGLWHFDGSLNSHKGVAADSDALFGGGCFGQALSIATGKKLKVPTTDMLAGEGVINFRAKNLAESANGSVLVDVPDNAGNQGMLCGIADNGKLFIEDAKLQFQAVETSQADFNTGTLSDVQATSAGNLELARDGQDFTYAETSQADFQSGTLTDVVVTSAGDLELTYTPGEVIYGSDFTGGKTYSADSEYTSSFMAANAFDNNTGTRWIGANVGFPHWVKVDLGSGITKIARKLRIYKTDADHLRTFKLQGSNDDTDWTDIYTDVASQTTGWLEYTFSNSTAYRYYRIYCTDNYIDNNFIRIGEIELMEAVETQGTYTTSGTREKNVDLSGAVATGGTKIEWSKTTPANTAVKVETALSIDGGTTYEAYQEATSGSSIPGITAQTDLSNARLKIRQTLTTSDTSNTPQLHSLDLSIYAPYKSSGYRYKEYDISAVGEVGSSQISWTENKPTDTTLTVKAAISVDGGSTYGDWQTCTSGSAIPGLTQGVDISNARLKVQEDLATTDETKTPQLQSLSVEVSSNVKTAYGVNKSTLTAWDSISLAWKSDRLSLVVNDTEYAIENPGLPTAFGSYLFIGTDRNGANAINTLVDELRIDKVYRDASIRTGWHKAGVPFYTSEDMKQWPGYLRAETDGLKVYDSSDALRVLVGSWLEDAVRKYGIKIIGGEMYSSLIRSGAEDATSYIQFSPPNSLQVWHNSKAQMNIHADYGARIDFFQNAPDTSVLNAVARITGGYSGADLGIMALGGTSKIAIGPNLHVLGSITASDKSNVEYTDYGPVKLTVRESPEHKYVDEGFGVLESGFCRIDLDPIFTEVIEPHAENTRWNIQLTPYADVSIYVAEIGADYFVVKEKNSGINTGVEFAWSLSATRKNYANIRFLGVID